MELYYLLIIVGVLFSDSSKAFTVIPNDTTTTEIPQSLALVLKDTSMHEDRSNTDRSSMHEDRTNTDRSSMHEDRTNTDRSSMHEDTSMHEDRTNTDRSSMHEDTSMHEDRTNTDRSSIVELPTYSIYLIGFTIFFMLIAIISLSVALYLALKNKSIFEINASNKQYVKQESTGVTPLCNTSYDHEQIKNNGSTLTMNSGIIEISEPRNSNPTTPTRIEESKIVFAKKPLKPIVPVMHRGQMDAICKEVLNKVAKSDSACYRDLNDLLKFENKNDSSSTNSEDMQGSKNELKPEFAAQLLKLKKPEMKTVTEKEIKTESQNAIKTEIRNANNAEMKSEPKQETKNETKNQTEKQTKLDENKDVRIEVNTIDSDKNEDGSDSETEYDTVPSPIRFRHSGPEPEQDMYDTVPNPTRFRHSGPEPDQCMYDTVSSPKKFRNSGAETDDDIDDIPLYDLPPRRGQESPSRNVIQMDPESHYLMPISKESTDSCYINAKRHSFNAPKS